MAVTYTTAALVKKRAKKISTSLLDADIEENIYQAESTIDVTMKLSARGVAPDFTFDSTKHGLIRQCCTDLAAFLCVIYDPEGSFTDLAHAEADFIALWNLKESSLAILSDPRNVTYLKGL